MDLRMGAIIGLVVLIIVIFIWKRRGTEKQKNKKSSPKRGSKGGKKPSRKQPDQEDFEDDEDEPAHREAPQASGNVSEDAKELYNLVHNELAGGMQIDAFEEVAGDLAGEQPSEVFVALKQKYTEAIDANRDPLRSVKLTDYVEVLKNN